MTNENEEPATRRSRRGADVGQGHVADVVNEANAQGYYGVTPDATPNEHYTVSGVTSGKPTPETESQGERRALPDADR